MTNSVETQSSPTVVDGVTRLSTTGISIIVAGGGIGGLMFALEAWRLGHDVKVFERNQKLDVLGDAFGVLPPAWTSFHYFPNMKVEYDREAIDAVFSMWHYDGYKLVHHGDAPWNAPGVINPAKGVHVPWLQTRPVVAQMLTGQCQRLGIPIEYGSPVVTYSETEEKAVVQVKTDGGVVQAEADIVVAADGVGTKSHAHITGHPIKVTSSGYSVYRGLFHLSDIKGKMSSRIIEKFFSGPRPEFRVYGCPSDTHANIILSKELFSYALTYKDSKSSEKDSKESWTSTVPTDHVLKRFSNLEPDLVELLRLIPDHTVVDWTLRWRDPQPKWASEGGRVVQLGDSAHSFLPTSGNGATQACEDALSLATCLRIAGKGKESIATKVHNKLRFERVSIIQKSGFKTRSSMHTIDLEAAKRDPDMLRQMLIMPQWIWSHNPVQYALDNYEQALKHILEGAPFQNTNIPQGYKYEPWTVAGEMEKEEKETKKGSKNI